MNTTIDLEDLERRAYLTIWEDGLVDAAVGLGLVAVGVAWVTGNIVMGAIVPAFMVPFWSAARKWITLPRAGTVRLSQHRMSEERRKLAGFTAAGVAVLVMAIAGYFLAFHRTPSLDQFHTTVIPSLLLAFGSILVGLLFGMRRFLVYALLLVLVSTAGTLMGLEPGWHILASGVGVTLSSVGLLLSFLRRHPAPGSPEEAR